MLLPKGLCRPRTISGLGVTAAFASFMLLLHSAAWAFSARPLLRLTGEATNDAYGTSASGAGDVNGDGYADVIVGAYGSNAGGVDAGRAYIYFGGPAADQVADLTLTGLVAGDLFGASVSGAGDVNGDGFDDVIVGAFNNDAGGNDAGRAYVYYGGSSPNAVADLILTGAAANDFFGYSVSGAGDLNGDGYSDVIVGAPQNNAGGSSAGRAYVFFGGPAPDTVPDLTLTGQVDELLGISVSDANDTNGDGYDDVIVGTEHTGAPTIGRAYVFYGGAPPNSVADLTLTGQSAGDLFGRSVSGAGDLNADGYSDVIVGAYLNSAGGSTAGRAYVYYCGPGADTSADLTLTGTAGERLGNAVSSAGDVNGDGNDDVIVGAYLGAFVGKAYVYFGGLLVDSAADLILTGASDDNEFGSAVSGAEDVNVDGYADVIVGSPLAGSTGRAYVYTSRPYEVLSPNGGEQWVEGQGQRVRWLGANLADIWVSFDGGGAWSSLASGVGGALQNEFTVIAPGPATTSALVRISASSEPVTHASSDVSDGVFSIVTPRDPPAAANRQQLTLTAAAAGDNFGFAASGAGDVNGDGYDDVIVGALLNDAAGAEAGRAYVFFGGAGGDAVPDLTLTGAASLDFFGTSVAGVGDMNGDGYADVVVGANGNDAGGSAAGRAYVYFGGATPDAIADLTLTGAAANDNFGASVSSAGDVNRDGYADLIVGAYLNDAGASNAGRAYVYFGGPTPDNTADWILTGVAADDNFGRWVSSAGDVNGDGFGDVVVGAPLNDAGGLSAGRAYVFYGGTAPNAVADLIWTGEAAGDQFGFSVSGAGDTNGDGFADVIVGALMNDFAGADAGRAYLFLGGPDAGEDAAITLTGQAGGDQFGLPVSSAGDVNRDGYADLFVGASGNDASGASAGRAYVYFGGPGADAQADAVLSGAAAGDAFGRGGAAGDWNRDGFADVIVGAFANDAAGGDAGRAYVYDFNRYFVTAPNGGETWNVGTTKTVSWLGAEPADVWLSTDGGGTYTLLEGNVGGLASNALPVRVPRAPTRLAVVRVAPADAGLSGSDKSDGPFAIVDPVDPPAAAHRLQLLPTGAVAGDFLGFSVSGAGDVNGDGHGDLIAGAYGNDAAGSSAGRAYVMYGGPGADATADLTLTGVAAGDAFGWSVSDAGDVNGDGFGDVIVGAFGNDTAGSNAGRAYVFFGGVSTDAVADVTLTGAAADDFFGMSVSGAGDVNGDGYGDLIVGANGNDAGGSFAGRTYLYFGGVAPDAVADLVLTGAAAGDNFGASVSGAGDVNGDGYEDFIVGAYINGAGGPNAGRAYVYFGGRTVDAIADLVLTGTANSDFGFSVSGAGDVNGDGYADVVVGAAADDAGAGNAGRAYVFYGGSAPDAVADVIFTGEAANNQFGYSVSGAGDLNRDGFGDVVVGSPFNGAGGVDAGRAYVFLGGPGVDGVADITFTGAVAGDNLGNSVSAARDVNGDNFDDVIVGAPGFDMGGADAGRAYFHDFNRYFVIAPNGGETWNVGAVKTVSWLGAEPADIWLSADGGKSFELLRSNMGGAPVNAITLRVPHTPSKFAMMKVTPSIASIPGQDASDSLFTIQTSVALLSMLAAPLPDGGVSIRWQTDPGPEDLAGYRVEKGTGSAGAWTTLVGLTRETSVTDLEGGPGSRYRLFAVNGFGEELWLGEAALRPLAPLSAWPLPYRGGNNLTISFATTGGVGGGASRAELLLFDVRGRLVRRLDSGLYTAGYRTATWDGRDSAGQKVATGLYFLRTKGEWGYERSIKVAVLR